MAARLPILDRLRGRVVQEGFEEDSPEFKLRFLEVRVEACQENKGVPTCQSCGYFEACELGKELMLQQWAKAHEQRVQKGKK